MACAMSVSVLSVPSKPAVVLFSGHSGFFPQFLKTDSDRYAGMTLRVQCTVRKLTLNPTSFLGVF